MTEFITGTRSRSANGLPSRRCIWPTAATFLARAPSVAKLEWRATTSGSFRSSLRRVGGTRRPAGWFLHRRCRPPLDVGRRPNRWRHGDREQFPGCRANRRALRVVQLPLRSKPLQQSRPADPDVPDGHLATDQPGHTRHREGLTIRTLPAKWRPFAFLLKACRATHATRGATRRSHRRAILAA